MGRRRNELRNAASFILKLRIIVVAVRYEDQFLYANFSAPPHFWLVPPHFICSGNGTAQGSRPRTQKKNPRSRTALPRTDPLEQARSQKFAMGGLFWGSGGGAPSRRRPMGVWGRSPQPPEAGGLGAKPPAAGGTGVWGRSPQRSKILHFFLQK